MSVSFVTEQFLIDNCEQKIMTVVADYCYQSKNSTKPQQVYISALFLGLS